MSIAERKVKSMLLKEHWSLIHSGVIRSDVNINVSNLAMADLESAKRRGCEYNLYVHLHTAKHNVALSIKNDWRVTPQKPPSPGSTTALWSSYRKSIVLFLTVQ